MKEPRSAVVSRKSYLQSAVRSRRPFRSAGASVRVRAVLPTKSLLITAPAPIFTPNVRIIANM